MNMFRLYELEIIEKSLDYYLENNSQNINAMELVDAQDLLRKVQILRLDKEIAIAFSKTYKELCVYNGFNHSVWIKHEWFNAIKQQMIELE